MYLSINTRAASAYNRVGVETSVEGASPHELIELLYDDLLQQLSMAKIALERKDIAVKCKVITKSVRLLEEGLKGGLSPLGGELAENLRALYDYCSLRLTEANVHNNIAAVEEVRSLIEPLAESWKAIRDQVEGVQRHG